MGFFTLEDTIHQWFSYDQPPAKGPILHSLTCMHAMHQDLRCWSKCVNMCHKVCVIWLSCAHLYADLPRVRRRTQCVMTSASACALSGKMDHLHNCQVCLFKVALSAVHQQTGDLSRMWTVSRLLYDITLAVTESWHCPWSYHSK